MALGDGLRTNIILAVSWPEVNSESQRWLYQPQTQKENTAHFVNYCMQIEMCFRRFSR